MQLYNVAENVISSPTNEMVAELQTVIWAIL